MNLLDIALVIVAVPAVIGGLRLGFLARATSWLGLVLGLLAAVQLAPTVIGWFGDAGTFRQLLVAALLLAVVGVAGQLLGLVAGSRLVVALPAGPARTADRALGGLAGLAGVVFAAWLLLPVMAEVPQWPARQVEGSALAAAVDQGLPEPPDALRGLAGALGDEDWSPSLEAELQDLQRLDPPEEPPVPAGLLDTAKRATVRIESDTCGERRTGTGFVVADGLVVTNAHVVAGERHPRVTDGEGLSHDGRIIVFDSQLDLAIVGVPDLDVVPLALAAAKRDDTGVALGFRGDDLRQHRFRVGFVGEGAVDDIYERGSAKHLRPMVGVASDLGLGDSGGPLVSPSGNVIGITFGVSAGIGVGWAVGTSSVEAVLDSAQRLLATDAGFERDATECLPDRI